MTRRCLVAAGIALGTLPVACERGDPLAPPHVYYGEEECAVCRMIISDERFAAAAIVQVEGVYRARLYDDIGCLLGDAESTDAPARYVHDLRSLEWVPFDDAFFVHSRDLRTPMASGVAAARSREDARLVLADYPGRTLNADELRKSHADGALHVLDKDTTLPYSPQGH